MMTSSTQNHSRLLDDKLVILREFPAFDGAGPDRTRDKETTVCYSKARNAITLDFPAQTAPLSVRCVFAGRETFPVGSFTTVVEQSSYLILNDGQTCKRQVQGMPELESLTIFFSVELAQSVLSRGLLNGDLLQFDGLSKNRLPVQFLERLREPDSIVSPRLARLRSLLTSHERVPEQHVLDEVIEILQRLLHVHRNDIFQAETLPFSKSKTKLEMFEKLHQAKDYISSNLEQDLTLVQIAEIIGLSQSHFQRCFTSFFEVTPHQYLIRCRLKRACHLLKTTPKTVTQVCLEVGFESLGSFSTLFSERFGVSPNRFRNLGADRVPRK